MPKWTLIFQFGSIFVLPQGSVRASHACKLPIAPMGKCIAECMIRLSLFYWDPFLFFQGPVRTSLACEFPIAPMGISC